MKLKDRLTKLDAQIAEKRAAKTAIHSAAGDAAMTDEQKTSWDALDAEMVALKGERARVAADIEDERTAPAVAVAPIGGARIRDVRARVEDDRSGAHGFRTPAEFLLAALANSAARSVDAIEDERLHPLALTGDTGAPKNFGDGMTFALPAAFTPRNLQAAVGSDEQGGYSDPYGGYAKPTTMLPGLLSRGTDADPTVGRTTMVPMASPTVKILARTDSTHTSSVSGGFTVARKAETAAAAASRMEMELVTLEASTLMGLAYATEEILTDSAITFVALIQAGFGEQVAFHMLHEKLFGLGGTEYIGAAAAGNGSRISATRDTASRVMGTDVLAMRARCWGYGNAIWIANQDIYGEIARLGAAAYDAEGTTPLSGSNALFFPNLQGDAPDRLLGRPIFFSESAETLGTTGDLILANFSQYLEGLYQPLQSAESMHVRFVNHERAFKFWLRNAGAPWWRAALTPRESTTTLSPFVVLS